MTASQRFLEKITKTDSCSCWNWNGATDTLGYGRFSFEGRNDKAHRVSYRLFSGDIPGNKCVLHRCDNRKCVNPSHLFLGTQQENVADMVSKGRGVALSGEAHPHSVVTKSKALEVIRLYKNGTMLQLEIATRLGISKSVVNAIIHRKHWSSATI